MLNKEAKTQGSFATARSPRAMTRRDERDRMRIERAFRRLLDGLEREPAIADLLSPRGDEGWH